MSPFSYRHPFEFPPHPRYPNTHPTIKMNDTSLVHHITQTISHTPRMRRKTQNIGTTDRCLFLTFVQHPTHPFFAYHHAFLSEDAFERVYTLLSSFLVRSCSPYPLCARFSPLLCKSISLNDAHSPCVSLPKPLILSAVYFMNNVPHYLRPLPTPGIFIIPALSSYFIRNSY